ncbi:MBL fold metallo-hydrolase [Tenacibaculum sp. TC6]|uniref:MBL fold metallo-hydrolase n=1 Tax=Tenacibaculum sp. TC6 TaxID=3423223 RepID=UPI003D35DB79
MRKKKQLKITFLGTGTSTGVPMISSTHPVAFSNDLKDKRLRSSIMISWDEVTYVIDCGPDFRQQMIRENVQKINGILFTHEHSDHIAGFDDIRPYSFQIGEVPIYVTERVLQALKKRYEYVFETENRYPSAPSVAPILISHKTSFDLQGVNVVPVEVMHGNLPVLGFRFNDFAYVTDIKTITETEINKLKNLDILVVTGLRKEPHATHFNIEEALQFVEKVQPKKTYLTHISELLGFHEEVEKELPENVFLAYDGLHLVSE